MVIAIAIILMAAGTSSATQVGKLVSCLKLAGATIAVTPFSMASVKYAALKFPINNKVPGTTSFEL